MTEKNNNVVLSTVIRMNVKQVIRGKHIRVSLPSIHNIWADYRNKQIYTTFARIYGFKCFYNEGTSDVEATNWFNKMMINLCIRFDLRFLENKAFKIVLLKKD